MSKYSIKAIAFKASGVLHVAPEDAEVWSVYRDVGDEELIEWQWIADCDTEDTAKALVMGLTT